MALSPPRLCASMSAGSADTIAFTRSNSPALIASIKAALLEVVSGMPRFYRAVRAAAVIVALVATAGVARAQTSPTPRPSQERPTLGASVTVDALGSLPSSANLFSLLDTVVPDVIADRIDTGGLSAGAAARVGAHGSTWTQTLFTLGDVDITDPNGTGAPLLLPGADTWQRADVTTGLMPIERSAPGLAVTLIPRTPA